MGEVVNVLVAFVVIVFLFRWITSTGNEPNGQRSAAETLGFRPKNVTQDMVDTIRNMFPDIPPDNIRYDLLRTGSVQQTSNKILEKGFLDAPPRAYYTLFPRTTETNDDDRGLTSTSTSTSKTPKENLISRYNLQDRINNDDDKDDDDDSVPISENQQILIIGGKAAWEDTPEKREASLRERKAQMILAARQRFAAQSQQANNGPTRK